MSLVSTLAKIAVGVAIAKGVSHISAGRTATAAQQSGGLGDIMGGLLGGASGGTSSASQGGLGGLLEQLAGQSGANRPASSTKAPSGIEDLLGSLTGGGLAGGLGGLLGGLTGGTSISASTTNKQSGGIGDLLGGLLGGAATSGAAAGGIGGLGGILNDILVGKQPAETPNPHQEVAAALMLKAMVQAAKSDGKLDQDEKQKLMQSLGDADPKEIAFVNDLLAQPVDIQGLVDAVPHRLEEQVYLMSLMAINLDSQKEAQYLHGLAQALGLGKPLINDIHSQAGLPLLYA